MRLVGSKRDWPRGSHQDLDYCPHQEPDKDRELSGQDMLPFILQGQLERRSGKCFTRVPTRNLSHDSWIRQAVGGFCKMLSKTLLRLLAVQIWACSATVLARNQHQSQHVLLQSEDGTSHHDRDQFLNFSSSAPHLFAATYSLLQQWSNTIFPNGHTVAPVEIPPYTLFYHGRVDGDLPPSPEWLAFDL